MTIERVEGPAAVAVVTGTDVAVTDSTSALDLAMSVKYETGATRIAIDKRLICEDFFILSTGLAGEVLQKFINYHLKVAFFGDFTRYTSRPLRDFIRESNRGRDVFFVETREKAVKKLVEATE